MNYFYLDASAWVKRYHTEAGSDLITTLYDTLHLSVALEFRETLSALKHTIVLVAADERLIRASKKEGVHVFNPESGTASHLRRLISG